MFYFDTSALLKKYIVEPGSSEVRGLIAHQRFVGTCSVARAEGAAALARAVRVGSLTEPSARQAHKVFIREWKSYVRVRVTEALVARADGLAWSHKLRGYDAIHLAAALEWQDRLSETITMATFDKELWAAAAEAGIARFPTAL